MNSQSSIYLDLNVKFHFLLNMSVMSYHLLDMSPSWNAYTQRFKESPGSIRETLRLHCVRVVRRLGDGEGDGAADGLCDGLPGDGTESGTGKIRAAHLEGNCVLALLTLGEEFQCIRDHLNSDEGGRRHFDPVGELSDFDIGQGSCVGNFPGWVEYDGEGRVVELSRISELLDVSASIALLCNGGDLVVGVPQRAYEG